VVNDNRAITIEKNSRPQARTARLEHWPALGA
jgi:hypothetical protein